MMYFKLGSHILFPTIFALTNTHVTVAQDCFSSTKRLLRAQLADLEAGNEDVMEYIICPETQINVGPPLNLRKNRFLYDFPIVFVRPNITIKCGNDGSLTNNCVLNARKAVFLAGSINDLEKAFGVKDINVDGSKLQGFTFTGNFAVDRGFFSLFSASALIHNAPGTLIIRDCAFKEMLAFSLLSVTDDSPSSIPANSSTLVIENSYCEDIEYNGLFLYVTGQNLKIRNSSFRNIRFRSYRGNEGDIRGVFGITFNGGSIDAQDSCFSEIATATTLFMERTHDGSNGLPLSGQLTFNNSFAEKLTLVPYEGGNEAFKCENGLAFLNSTSPDDPSLSFLASCTNPFTAKACPSTVSNNVHTVKSESSFSSFWHMFGM